MTKMLFEEPVVSQAPLLFKGPPKKSDLVPPATLLPEMAAIRGHVAGNSVGITRDEAIISELVKILHAKTYDEVLLRRRKAPRFYHLEGEEPAVVAERVEQLLREAHERLDHQSGRATDDAFTLSLDAGSVAFAVGVLHRYAILSAERDVLGEAFESLIGPSLRGAKGQFFTPRNLTKMCVEMLNPQPGERIIDPACGAGGFLGDTLRHLSQSRSRKSSLVVGIDKDEFLATLCADHLALYQEEAYVFCENSLAPPDTWSSTCASTVTLGSFDLVLTNPPFGAAIPVKGKSLLRQYDLAHRWYRLADGSTAKSDELLDKRPPQVLFIERCLQLLRPGGRAAIVLPEGIFGNENEQYIRDWILSAAHLLAVVDCPLETFMPSTPTKTCVLFLEKADSADHSPKAFFAVASHCGHDRRGKPIYDSDGSRKDDFSQIASEFLRGKERDRA